MRKSHRSPTEKIEDAFSDLAIKDQELVLRMLQSLHRQRLRVPTVPPGSQPPELDNAE